jgi:hypothetical protein
MRYDIQIQQGATFRIPFAFLQSNNAYLDLTGYTARMQIRRSYGSTDVLASPTCTIALNTTPNPDRWELTVSLTAAQTASLVPTDGVPYRYDIELVVGAEVTRILEGYCTVTPEITR